MILAAYKGTRPGVAGLYNRLGRRIAQGPYSHTELIFPEYGGVSWSSSYMDGGVRGKMIGYSSKGCWDFYKLPPRFDAAKALKYCQERDGWPYDVRGNMRFGIAIVVPSDSKEKIFCSEIIAGGLELPEPFKIDPVSLVHWILYLGAEKIDGFNLGENP